MTKDHSNLMGNIEKTIIWSCSIKQNFSTSKKKSSLACRSRQMQCLDMHTEQAQVKRDYESTGREKEIQREAKELKQTRWQGSERKCRA